MKTTDCQQEKRSSQVLGFLAIPFVLLLISPLMVLFPFIALFAVPVLGIAAVFIFAPQSKVCRLITDRVG